MDTDPIERIRQARARKARTKRADDQATAELREAVAAALATLPPRRGLQAELAEAAGYSRETVRQLGPPSPQPGAGNPP